MILLIVFESNFRLVRRRKFNPHSMFTREIVYRASDVDVQFSAQDAFLG